MIRESGPNDGEIAVADNGGMGLVRRQALTPCFITRRPEGSIGSGQCIHDIITSP